MLLIAVKALAAVLMLDELIDNAVVSVLDKPMLICWLVAVPSSVSIAICVLVPSNNFDH